ncbi:MAG: toprim domain-containing protein [Magnetococcales bacterium]|nr:toprim domain-containing protein [Magnetococcales bacterium]
MDERKSPAGGPGGRTWIREKCTSSGGRAQERFDADRVRAAAQNRWRSILAEMGVNPSSLDGRHHPCPACGGTDRFRFDDREGYGSFICSQCGAGDGFSLVARLLHLDSTRDFSEVVARVAELVGAQPEADPRNQAMARPAPTRPAPQPTDDQRARERLRIVWGESFSLADPGAEPARRYLEARGLGAIVVALPGTGVVRCHPALPYFEDGREIGRFPALVAVVQDVTGRAVSLHRTYLSGEGRKADLPSVKKLMPSIRPGVVKGASIRLYPATNFLGVCEGIETALAVRAATGQPVWAAITASGMAALALPPTIREIFIWCDMDANGVGQQAAMTKIRKP